MTHFMDTKEFKDWDRRRAADVDRLMGRRRDDPHDLYRSGRAKLVFSSNGSSYYTVDGRKIPVNSRDSY